MKKKIRLTESDLHNIISKSVMRILQEGSTADTGVPTAWENIKEQVGAEHMIDAIWNYADSDTLKNYVDWMIDDFDLDPSEIYEMENSENEDIWDDDDDEDQIYYEEDPDYPAF